MQVYGNYFRRATTYSSPASSVTFSSAQSPTFTTYGNTESVKQCYFCLLHKTVSLNCKSFQSPFSTRAVLKKTFSHLWDNANVVWPDWPDSCCFPLLSVRPVGNCYQVREIARASEMFEVAWQKIVACLFCPCVSQDNHLFDFVCACVSSWLVGATCSPPWRPRRCLLPQVRLVCGFLCTWPEPRWCRRLWRPVQKRSAAAKTGD